MNVLSLLTKREEQEPQLCTQCGKKLGTGPSGCRQCGAWRANPLEVTRRMRRMPKPVPNWRRALRSLAPLSVLALDPHLTWHEKTSLLAGLGVAWVCVPAFALGMNWSVRRRSLEWGDIWTLYEKVLPAYFLVCLVAGLVIEVTHPKPSEVLSCYGACSGKIDGVSTVVAIAAGAAVLAILLSLVLGASLRTLAGSRLAQAAGAAHGTRRRAAGNRWAP